MMPAQRILTACGRAATQGIVAGGVHTGSTVALPEAFKPNASADTAEISQGTKIFADEWQLSVQG